jgi:Fe-S cluster biogenesis protein NfuA
VGKGSVIGEKEFQRKIERLGALVSEIEQKSVAGPGVTSQEVVQLLMEVHGAGLERVMEIVFEAGAAGEAIISRLGIDPITRSLLLLYSLHPDPLETRIAKALEQARPRLRKLGGEAELIAIRDGAVEVKLRGPEHSCGSTADNLRAVLVESIYELAPDVASLTILAPEPEMSGFVALEALLANRSQSTNASEGS